jgi:hypothetical protein
MHRREKKDLKRAMGYLRHDSFCWNRNPPAAVGLHLFPLTECSSRLDQHSGRPILRLHIRAGYIQRRRASPLLFAGIIRTIPRLRERNAGRMIAIGYFVIFAFSLVRGIMNHGFAHAASGSRLFVGFLIACAYFLTAPVDPSSVRRYVNIYLCYGLGLTVVAFLAYAGLDVGGIAWAHHDPIVEGMMQGRLLPASCALAFAFCFFFSLADSHYRSSPILFRWLPIVFLGLAVSLRHRSVWVVLAAGIVSFLFVDRRLFRRMIPVAVLTLCLSAGYALLVLNNAQSAGAKFAESATSEQSWLFRLETWQGLVMDKEQTVSSVLFGKDLGGGYRVFDVMAMNFIDVLPHNEYVAQFLSVGLAGVAPLLCFTIRPLRRFWKLSSTDLQAIEPSASAWVAVILGIMVFSVPYQPMVDAYALLGIANAMVFRLYKEAKTRELSQ